MHQTIIDLEEHVVEEDRARDHVGLVHFRRAGRELDAVVVRVRADGLEDLAGRLGREVRTWPASLPSHVAEVALAAEPGAAAEERGPQDLGVGRLALRREDVERRRAAVHGRRAALHRLADDREGPGVLELPWPGSPVTMPSCSVTSSVHISKAL